MVKSKGKIMNAFAGFWVDGAVRKPEARHGSNRNAVYVQWKDGSDIGTCNVNSVAVRWENLHWLDTTPRESLTPEELLALAMVLWPDIATIYKHEDVWYSDCQGKDSSNHIKIDWGNLTQYPPPVEPQWVRITRENVGKYMHKPCRFHDNKGWCEGYVAGWITIDGCCLVESDYSNTESVMQWSVVEVQA